MPYPLLRIEGVRECTVISRINKFVVKVKIDNDTSKAYLNNTGRLLDYIARDRIGYCIRVHGRKLNYRLIAVGDHELGAILDTQLQEKSFEYAVSRNYIPWLIGCHVLRRNIRLGSSIIDYLLECNSNSILLEIKSAVLRKNKYIALYPDCPSLRGRKQVKSLITHVLGGGKAILLFIAVMPYVKAFTINREVDNILYELVVNAVKLGVKLRALSIYYDPKDNTVYLDNPELDVII